MGVKMSKIETDKIDKDAKEYALKCAIHFWERNQSANVVGIFSPKPTRGDSSIEFAYKFGAHSRQEKIDLLESLLKASEETFKSEQKLFHSERDLYLKMKENYIKLRTAFSFARQTIEFYCMQPRGNDEYKRYNEFMDKYCGVVEEIGKID